MPVIDTTTVHYRALLGAAALVIIVAGLRAVSKVLDPLLMAGVVVACAAPLQEQLRRRGLPRVWAMAVTALMVTLVLLAFIALFGYAAKALVETVPQYQDRLNALLQSGTSWFTAHGVDASKSKLLALMNPARLVALASDIAQGLGGALGEALLILLLSIFLLVESSAFWRRKSKGTAAAEEPASVWFREFEVLASDVQQYFWLTMVTGLIYAVAVWIVMVIIGTDLPVLWAVVALLLTFVPGVGFPLSIVPPALLTLLEFGLPRTGVLIGVFLFIANIVDNVIKPRVMKQGFDLGPFVAFAAVLFWTYVLGPTGALLAIPLTTAVRRAVMPSSESADVPAKMSTAA